MISVYPQFYKIFACKADACQKHCCQHWEIDIDPSTASLYKAMPGEMGDFLRQVIVYDEIESSYHFKLREDGQCPMLQNGLCRIILEQGEEYLSEVCHMHPRFFKYLADYEFCGMGLSCEKSCELLLAEKGEDLLLEIEIASELIRFTLPELLKKIGILESGSELSFKIHLEETYWQTLLGHLSNTEPMNEVWTKNLQDLIDDLPSRLERLEYYLAGADLKVFTRLYQYILYRQLDLLEDYSFELIKKYTEESVAFILLRTSQGNELLEEIANWSEQIEYDTDNVEILLNELKESKKSELTIVVTP